MTVSAATTAAERPGLAAWRARHELRRSNAARPIPSATRYRRTSKNARTRAQREGEHR
ncbi:hypothetical protein [Nocardia nova]|uniref:hypothetical protein n=1 Tax=Nocardia nova TaxID=37330 RepID=UPI0033CD0105